MSTEEKQHEQRDKELKQAIEKMGEVISRRLLAVENKVNPMYEIFASVNGFNKIAVWIVKILAGVGTILIGLYAIIEFFKRLGEK